MDDSGAESLGTQENPVSVDLRLAHKHAPVLRREVSSDEDPGAEISGDDDLEITVGTRKRRRCDSPSVGDVSPGSSSGADAVDHVPKKRWNAHPKKRNVDSQDVPGNAEDSPESSAGGHVPKSEEAITIKCEPWSPDDGANSTSSDGGGSHDAEKDTKLEQRLSSGTRRIPPAGASSRSTSPRSRSPKDSTGSATPPNGATLPFDYQRFPVGMMPLMGLPQLNRGFVCEPCGIRFSSPGTLQAHQTYYCAARKSVDNGEASPPEEKKTIRPAVADPPVFDLNAFGKPGVTSPPLFIRPPTVDPAAVMAACSPQPAASPSPDASAATRLLKCPQCAFTTDKKPLLVKHIKSHCSSDTETADESQNSSDRYCHDCGIQFSSTSTFRVHRKHYCQGRRNVAPPGPSPDVGAPPASLIPPLIGLPPLPGATSVTDDRTPCVILPTNPLLVIPYPILQCARFVPLGAIPPECLVVGPDGTLTTRSNQIAAFSANATLPTVSPRGQPRKSRNQSPETNRISPGKQSPKARPSQHKMHSSSNGIEEEAKNGQTGDDFISRPDSPLDLSRQDQSPPLVKVKIEPEEPQMSPRISTKASTSAQEPIEEVDLGPSLALPPGIQLTKAKDSKRQSPAVDVGGNSTASPAGIPGLILPSNLPFPAAMQDMMSAELLNSAAAVFGRVPSGPGMQQPYVVKKGVCKCSECNIVFYKRENYLIHKKHYCASRQLSDQEDLPPLPVQSRKNSGPKEVKPSASNTPVLETACPHLCTACGTKFSSVNTLTAHQSFYCTKLLPNQQPDVKKGVKQPDVQQCPACLAALAAGVSLEEHLPTCSAMRGGNNALQQVWQCPCCEFMTTSVPVAQCHLERHAGLQAFRCLLCGYKGNTLRGMRIHIRMHFDPKQTDIPEESIISYIVAGEVELPSGGLLAGLAGDSNSADSSKNDSSSEDSPRGKSSVKQINRSRSRTAGMRNGASGSDSREGSPDVNDNQTSPASGESYTDAMDSSHPQTDHQLDRKSQKKLCRTCKVSFSHLPSFIQHKKLHCPSRIDKSSSSPHAVD